MNLCTVTISVAPEVQELKKPVSLGYLCCNGGNSTVICEHYKPPAIGGTTYPYGCRWFKNGCTCPAAKKKARERARTLLAASL